MKTWYSILLSLLLVTPSVVRSAPYQAESGSAAEKGAKLTWKFTPDPALPNVLILGDSISIGYTLQVRELLKGKANVYRPMEADGKKPANCQGSGFGVKQLDRWLEGPKWAVIHFNWGLHDMKHVKVPGSSQASSLPEDPLQATVQEYSSNLELLLPKLKATGARLVFATTTPVQPGTTNPLREPESPQRYNAAALDLFQGKGVRVNDLFGFCQPQLEQIQLPKNVHFTDAGSRVLAGQVAKVIEEELAASK